ncbi:MAG TPA: fructosamine kinase family protein [Candidatus Binatia bacterium]|nr:fructosamine kinase family protein [Candidatus Binatia bacterium]
MNATARQRIELGLGAAVTGARPLGGGCVADVHQVTLADGRAVVAKVGQGLGLEGWMLRYLCERTSLPVPAVLLCEDDLLVMEHVVCDGRGDAGIHAAELLAALHSIPGDSFGFERDTLIGSLPQPNPSSPDWIEFFRDHRLMHFGRLAVERGRLDPAVLQPLERMCARLETWLVPAAMPSLIHGDVWGGNVLVHGGRVAAFIDPALYFADAEIELAFTTLFSTFSQAFYRRYDELRPIAPGFFEERCAIYNLYPLLVHTLLFGGSYARSVEATVRRMME